MIGSVDSVTPYYNEAVDGTCYSVPFGSKASFGNGITVSVSADGGVWASNEGTCQWSRVTPRGVHVPSIEKTIKSYSDSTQRSVSLYFEPGDMSRLESLEADVAEDELSGSVFLESGHVYQFNLPKGLGTAFLKVDPEGHCTLYKGRFKTQLGAGSQVLNSAGFTITPSLDGSGVDVQLHLNEKTKMC